ncbi:helix-turn-helix domain-containing protein [Kineococcus aurantiacus]|uniref:helix-turn-helix domain-containing protein n=1 Tax=Kineococcus aurantiacus TaxID=37633 RepID=UPI001C53957E
MACWTPAPSHRASVPTWCARRCGAGSSRWSSSTTSRRSACRCCSRSAGSARSGCARCAPRAPRCTAPPRLTRDDSEPAVFLGLQVTGSSLVVQHGREAVLRPGEFAVYDTSSPYTLVHRDGIDQHFFRIPRSALVMSPAALRGVTAVTVGAGNPVAGLAAGYLRGLAGDDDLRSDPRAGAVEEATVSLVKAALMTHLADGGADGGAGREALHESLEARITAYLRAHLTEPDLSAERIAAAHHISTRYLYVILARCGITLGDWLRGRRLSGCRDALADPGLHAVPISALARRWGFTDPGHFSRCFREAYGCTPTQWRQQHASPRRVDGR